MKKIKVQIFAANEIVGMDEIIHEDMLVITEDDAQIANIQDAYLIKVMLRRENIFANVYTRTFWQRLFGIKEIHTFCHNGKRWQRRDKYNHFTDESFVKSQWGLWDVKYFVEDFLEDIDEEEYFDYILPNKSTFNDFYGIYEEEPAKTYENPLDQLEDNGFIPYQPVEIPKEPDLRLPPEHMQPYCTISEEEAIVRMQSEAAEMDLGVINSYVAPVVTHSVIDDTPSRSYGSSSSSSDDNYSSSSSSSSDYS